MRRWIIVDKKTNRIIGEYKSDKKEQGTNRFGGPWDNPALFMHLRVLRALDSEPISNLEVFQGEVIQDEADGTVCCREVAVTDAHGNPIMDLAFDSNDQPLKDANGVQIRIPRIRKTPVTVNGTGVRKKS